MTQDRKEGKWETMYQQATADLAAWRRAHPYATFNEIETEMDKKMSGIRAQMLADLAGEAVLEEDITCPECGERMHRRGKKKRRLQAQGGEEIELDRHYAVCPNCGEGLFPPR